MQPKGKGITPIQETRISARGYIEEGYSPIPSVRLDAPEYSKGLQRFVPCCADVVPIDSKRMLIYLAWRRSKPMTGWWWLGGGLFASETFEEAAVRCVKRETKIEINPLRLQCVADNDYFWRDRAQEPQNIGCHMFGRTYALDVTLAPEEIEMMVKNLDPDEYDPARGLRSFTLAELEAERVFPAIIDFYCDVFGLVPATRLACKIRKDP